MCIAFIKVARSNLDKYKLILLNNRDEQLFRPTLAMHWHDGILSGNVEKVSSGLYVFQALMSKTLRAELGSASTAKAELE